jgi:hypothetical protein
MFARRKTSILAFALVAVLAAAIPAGAQPPSDQWASGKWRFGPLAVTPSIQLKNLGWDSNVFNEPKDPKSDFTTTVAAPIDWWFRFGRGRLHGVNTLEGVFFARYADQRGLNQRHELTMLVPLNRIRPYVGVSWLSTNDRPGYEIDARVRHTEAGVNGGALVRVSSRTDLDVSARQTRYRYQDEDFAGAPYSLTLDRRTSNYGAQVRYRVSSLTTLTLLADGVRERFTGSPERDNNGFRILSGVELDPYALIKGRAQIGYRKLNTIAAGMPDFSGLVASGELAYALRGATRFAIGVARDVLFSYSTTEPFYIQTGLTLSVTRQVSGPWDVQARAGWYSLDYQHAAGAASVPSASRADRYRSYGGGVGYRVGKDVRVGFNIDAFHRESAVAGRAYDGMRGGLAATYVF